MSDAQAQRAARLTIHWWKPCISILIKTLIQPFQSSVGSLCKQTNHTESERLIAAEATIKLLQIQNT